MKTRTMKPHEQMNCIILSEQSQSKLTAICVCMSWTGQRGLSLHAPNVQVKK